MTETSDIHQVFALHISKEKPLRAAAYALSKKLEEGHICVDMATYNEALGLEEKSPFKEHNPFLAGNEPLDIPAISSNHLVSKEIKATKPFVLANDRLYLQRYFHYETEILEGIKRRIEYPLKDPDLSKYKGFIGNMFANTMSPDQAEVDWQMVAAIRAMVTRFLIVTGGPGTGKTTTVAKILVLAHLVRPDVQIALAAPTGKAAARLNESLAHALQLIPELPAATKSRIESFKASTIHRLLGARMNSPFFKYNRQNPLKEELVIVDESSMVDAALMAKLISAVNPEAGLILLGDKDQLASVEAGSIFGDLCLSRSDMVNAFSPATVQFINDFIPEGQSKLATESLRNNVPDLLGENIIELTKSYRFNKNEGIGQLSKSIISGELPVFESQHEKDNRDVTLVDRFDFDSLSNNPEFLGEIEHFKDYIEEPDVLEAIRKINTVRVLCALNHGKFGVAHFNGLIETILKQKGLISLSGDFYHNRPVLVTRNDYSLGLFNGDVGIIRKDEQGELKAYFDGLDETGTRMLRSFPATYINGLRTVFAMTIHKSQGSEFDRVVIVLPDTDHLPILTRELLYTGVTRARSHSLLIGSEEVVRAAVKRRVSRASGIRERLQQTSMQA